MLAGNVKNFRPHERLAAGYDQEGNAEGGGFADYPGKFFG